MLKAVLFDLDGTLLPMDQEVFVKYYFGGLCKKLVPLGFDANELVKNIWAGTKAMITNNGSQTNEEVFWNYFKTVYGDDILNYQPTFEAFYHNEFQAVQQVCGFEAESARIIKFVKDKGLRVILATNPIFPAIATESRIKWAGLNKDDFEIITTYENSHYAKPNQKYYAEILQNAQLKPEECLMVGNDVKEDMVARTLGIDVFLLTNDLIADDTCDLSQYPQGDFNDLYQYLENK